MIPAARVPTLPALSDAELCARFFRTLGDATRIRILTLLLDDERRVGDLVGLLEAPQSRVSTHLGCLRWCGLVATRRAGKEVYYRLADPRVRDLLLLGNAVLHDHAAAVATCQIVTS